MYQGVFKSSQKKFSTPIEQGWKLSDDFPADSCSSTSNGIYLQVFRRGSCHRGDRVVEADCFPTQICIAPSTLPREKDREFDPCSRLRGERILASFFPNKHFIRMTVSRTIPRRSHGACERYFDQTFNRWRNGSHRATTIALLV